MFLSAEFFGFGYLPKTKADVICHYKFSRFDVNNGAKQLSVPSKVTYFYKVSTPTSFASLEEQEECLNNKSSDYYLMIHPTGTKNYATDYHFEYDKVQTFEGYVNPTDLTTGNKLTFVAEFYKGNKVITSTTWSMDVINSGGYDTSGRVDLSLSFQPAATAAYNKDQNISIVISAVPLTVRQLPSSVSELQMVTTINDKKIGEFPVSKDNLFMYEQKQNTKIVAPPFVNGQNTVKVLLYVKGVVNPVGQVSGFLSAQGLPEIAKPSSGTTPGNEGTNADGGGTTPGTNADGGGTTPGTNADGGGTTPGTNADGGGTTLPISGIDCSTMDRDSADYGKYCLYNPLPEDALTDMLIVIMKWLLAIIAVWAVVFIVIGGFRMVMAQGNEEQYTSAKKTITWAILGLVIALLSFSIVAMIQNFLGVKVSPTTPAVNVLDSNKTQHP